MLRVLRLLEYSYETEEIMAADMGRWTVGANSTKTFNKFSTIRSAIMLPEYIANIPEDDERGDDFPQ